ncbi:MAG: DNA methyltransferase [candidate division NC10 bacterium]|nr:DNA methyltransferase [candidate division NC10 bacterium]
MRHKSETEVETTNQHRDSRGDGSTSITLKERLDQVRNTDWNFADARTQGGVHRIHPYPAKFIPQIPRQLIRLLHPRDGSAVLDPFCGSGTALVETLAEGHPAIGIDLNPIATLVARVKTLPPARRISPVACQAVEAAAKLNAPIPAIPRVNHWFEGPVQEALAGLVVVLADVEDDAMREALHVALSSIIVRVSNQEGDTRYAAIKKSVSAELVYGLFKRSAADIDAAYAEQFGGLFGQQRPDVRVITKDVLMVTAEDIGAEIGLVVTSPPYPNAYEYWLYHKYRMYWLGMDPIAVRNAEIGARPHYFKKNRKTEADFEHEMGRVFALLSSVMRPTALACFVIGRSIIHGRTVDNVALIQRAALPHQFRPLLVVERVIPATRKAFNPAHGTINTESLVVFGR